MPQSESVETNTEKLWRAARAGHVNDVKRLTDDFNFEPFVFNLALHQACYCRQANVVRYLVMHTSLRDNVSELIRTLMKICRSGQLDMVKWIAEHPSIRDRVRVLRGLLIMICYKGHVKVMSWILNKTLLYDDGNSLGSALIAACDGRQLKAVYWIMKQPKVDVSYTLPAGSDPMYYFISDDYTVTTQNTALHCIVWCSKNNGKTLFHDACESGNADEVCSLLYETIENNSVDKLDNWGNTPLHLACYQDHSDIVKMLIAVLANLIIVNDKNELPADIATQRHWDDRDLIYYLAGI